METLPCPDFFSRKPLLKVICNSAKYLFPCLLSYLAVVQILWLCFVSSYKDEWATLIVLFLHLWIYISMFRSRTKIRQRMEELHRISNMMCVYTLKTKKIFKVCICLYCLFMTFLAIFLEVTLFNSGMIAHEPHKLRSSELIPAHFKEPTEVIINCWFIFTTLAGN
ncbi:hypothetical protein CEXT_369311 [Caerostris extrusa]|uniref:Uncharacterized protein n=1 Tax=Caerostris extrusa TaxID=172846 RepID=A0AAV4XKY2_CAEEX|nr:hypothetical protein CEXT_369311 [Caerostris extrusa]